MDDNIDSTKVVLRRLKTSRPPRCKRRNADIACPCGMILHYFVIMILYHCLSISNFMSCQWLNRAFGQWYNLLDKLLMASGQVQ